MLHELVDFNRVVIFVMSMDSETDRAYEAAVFTVGINADKCRILAMRMAIVRFDEILKALGELLDVCLNRHQLQIFLYPSIESSYQLHK